MESKKGKVYLVGAGPGDPGLITQKGLDLIRKAEVIFYDNLVNPKLLDETHREAELIYVGKRGEGTSTDQKEIEDQIVSAAKKGKLIVRLKGGDPFIFGRGGEEAERLVSEGIPFEIVPGVTSPIAVPAYAGIPLTHRDFTHTVVFVTGHPKENEKLEERSERKNSSFHLSPLTSHLSPIDWSALSKMGTIVFVMGVKTIRHNMESLMKAGKDFDTPVAVIRWGTYPRQKTILGTIGSIADEVEKIKLMPPAIVVVGEVVKLREKLRWFETKPLFGKRVIVTRARTQAGSLSERLDELGAEIIEIPTIEICPPASFKEVDDALHRIKEYHWIIFTSVHGVHYFFERWGLLNKDIRELADCHLAAVGSTTADALQRFHLKVEKIPEEFSAESLARCFSTAEVSGKKVLFPRAKEGREELIQDLQSKGAEVDVVTVYENKLPLLAKEKIEKLTKKEPIDLLTFTSSSTVKNFHDLLKESSQGWLLKTPAICMGPITEKTARELEFQEVIVSKKATIEEMVMTIREYLSKV
jgi:uroporphyrinogen III methyltransferase/synthase